MNNAAYRIATVAVLGLLAVAFVVAAVLILARGDGNASIQVIPPPSQVITPPNDTVTESTQTGGGSAPSTTQPEPDLRVYVNGAIQNPGVYQLKPGDRLVDALAAAGGATAKSDLTLINLAQRVRDEGYYYVPEVGETPPPIAVSAEPPSQPAESNSPVGAQPKSNLIDNLIDLNTGSAEALTSLPSIGPVKAQAIVAYREQNGPFTSVEEITNVSGIGPATYENIRNLVTVGAP